MILSRIALGIAASALIVGAASAHTHHRHHRHATAPASTVETPDVSAYSRPSSATVEAVPVIPGAVLITNGPVPDTPENRARYGQPLSHGGRATPPAGN